MDDVVDSVVAGYMAARPPARREILEQIRPQASAVDRRSPRHKCLAAFGMAACGTGDDFRYVSGTTLAVDEEDGLCSCRKAARSR